jgi:hypothetical protein
MEERRPDQRQRELLKRRGLNPADFVVVRVMYGAVWFRNIHTGMIKIVNKRN